MGVKKFTLLINWGEVAGYTETYYRFVSTTGVGDEATAAEAREIVNRRALVLTPFAVIIGVRASAVTAPKVVQLIKLAVRGQNTGTFSSPSPDIVQVAILATMSSNLGGKRQFLQRGLIDNDVVNGQITLASSGVAKFNGWFAFLSDGSFRMRDLTPIVTGIVDNVNGATGVLTKGVAGDFPEGSLVVVSTHVAGNGKRVRWTGKVLKQDGVALTLKNWRWGNCTGGTVTSQTESFGTIAPFIVPFPQRARIRQTGRPFDLLHGRQSNR